MCTKRGYITYSNEAKEKLLGVEHSTLESVGAVSPETAEQMARGAARQAGADAALSVTGIAGPDGGTPGKPVGLVYVGCCVRERPGWRNSALPGTAARTETMLLSER